MYIYYVLNIHKLQYFLFNSNYKNHAARLTLFVIDMFGIFEQVLHRNLSACINILAALICAFMRVIYPYKHMRILRYILGVGRNHYVPVKRHYLRATDEKISLTGGLL